MRTLALAAVLIVIAAFGIASAMLGPADEAATIARDERPEPSEQPMVHVAPPATGGKDEPVATADPLSARETRSRPSADRRKRERVVLAGRVIDTHGLAVAHARIRLGRSLERPLRQLEAEQKNPRGMDRSLRAALKDFDDGAREVRSNSEGEFAARGTLPTQLSVHVSHPKYLDTWLDGVGLGESLVIVLEDFTFLKGTVVDELTSRPVPLFGIRVLGRLDPVTPSDRRTRSPAKVRVVERARDPRSQRGVHPMLTAATNSTRESVPRIDGHAAVPLRYQPIVKREGGRFVIDRLRAGTYYLEVFSRTHAGALAGPFHVTPRSGKGELQIRLPRGQPLLGQVLDAHSGTGMPGARVVLYRGEPGAQGHGKRITSLETGDDGRFDFGHVRSGVYNVTAQARHYSTQIERGIELTPVAVERRLLFQLPKTCTLWGTVRNLPEGIDAWVFALTSRTRRRVQVGDDGSYALNDLDAGNYVVQLVQRSAGLGLPPLSSEREVANESPTVVLRPGDSVRFDLDAAEGAPRAVTGRVELDGAPGAGLRVVLYVTPLVEPSTFTRAERRRRPGSTRRNGRRSQSRRRPPSSRQSAPPRGPRQGRSWRRLSATTDEQGGFRIEGVLPGAYRLELSLPAKPAATEVTRRPGFGDAIYREDVLVLDRDDNRFDIDIETGTVQFVLHPGNDDEVRLWLSSNALPKSTPETWRVHPSLRIAKFVAGTATLERVRTGSYRYAAIRGKEALATGEVKVFRGDKTDKVTIRLE